MDGQDLNVLAMSFFLLDARWQILDAFWRGGEEHKERKGKRSRTKEPGPVTGAEPRPFLVVVVLLFTTTSTWTASSIASSLDIPEQVPFPHIRPR